MALWPKGPVIYSFCLSDSDSLCGWHEEKGREVQCSLHTGFISSVNSRGTYEPANRMSHILYFSALSDPLPCNMQVNESKESGNFYDLHKGDCYLMGMEEKQWSALPESLCLITSQLPIITGPEVEILRYPSNQISTSLTRGLNIVREISHPMIWGGAISPKISKPHY